MIKGEVIFSRYSLSGFRIALFAISRSVRSHHQMWDGEHFRSQFTFVFTVANRDVMSLASSGVSRVLVV